MSEAKWWKNGVQFECQGSGRCCVSRDGYGYVYVTLEDRRRFAKFFNLSLREFTKEYCEKDDGIWKIRDFTSACRFLKENRCSVYEARPTQCRTWPFWPETMKARAWKEEVAAYCPGVGKGRVWTAEEIKEQLRIQQKSQDAY
ncbi:MAG: YkgJ family cysteine cluster protein [Proteobacteria bacterium]|nr:MAG: YkgJ family cysteine cluster protein [Pseudomonadota bacterium]